MAELRVRFRENSRKEGLLGGAGGKEPICQCRRPKRHRFDPWVRKIPWRRARQPTAVFLPENPIGRGAWEATVHRVAESDTTEATQQARMHQERETAYSRRRRCYMQTYQ